MKANFYKSLKTILNAHNMTIEMNWYLWYRM